jgi:hypothetical protein
MPASIRGKYALDAGVHASTPFTMAERLSVRERLFPFDLSEDIFESPESESAGFALALLPLLEGADRDAPRLGCVGLGESGLCASALEAGSNFSFFRRHGCGTVFFVGDMVLISR